MVAESPGVLMAVSWLVVYRDTGGYVLIYPPLISKGV